MKNILFCNTTQPACGVYQYGRNLCAALRGSSHFNYVYAELNSGEMLGEAVASHDPVAVIYNWHPDQGGWMKHAPFAFKGVKQLLIYHDWDHDVSRFDAVLFSDPTMPDHDNWHSIPRPLPAFDANIGTVAVNEKVTIGVHGFFGATGDLVVARVMKEFDEALIRLHLPFAHYGDRDGATAKRIAETCRAMVVSKPGITLEIDHEWMSDGQLLDWLARNDLNCYLRDVSGKWLGVSSALDAALAVRKPIAVNKCEGFRHVFGCDPSICVEDRSLKEILATGTAPLLNLYASNRRERLVAEVDEIINGLTDAH